MRACASSPLHKTGFRESKRVGSFPSVLAALAALALSAGALALVVAALLAVRRARAVAARPLASALPDLLGDAALLLDRNGRIVTANAPARALLDAPATGALEGVSAAALVLEIEGLRRGLARGPAGAEVTVRRGAAAARARVALVRVGRRPVRDLLVLRVEHAAERPPPLPIALPPPVPGARLDGHADLAAVSAALRDPLARAATATAMIRLLAAALPPRPAEELARLEAALGELEGRLGALAAAGDAGAGRPRAVDLAAVIEDLLAGLTAPAEVRIRRALLPARAVADEARLRAALRAVLRAAVQALPAGGELLVSVAPRGASVLVEVASPGVAAAAAGGAVALARALLGPEGARVEHEAVPGRGRLFRIALPAALGAVPVA
jgi:signal transduction histidine kinase